MYVQVSLEQQLYEAESRADKLAVSAQHIIIAARGPTLDSYLQEALESVTSFFTSAASKEPEAQLESLPQSLNALPPPIQTLILSLQSAVARARSTTFTQPSSSSSTHRRIAQLELENQRLADLVGTSTTAHLQQQLLIKSEHVTDLEHLVQDLKATVYTLQDDADHFWKALQQEKSLTDKLERECKELRQARQEHEGFSSSRRRERSGSRDRDRRRHGPDRPHSLRDREEDELHKERRSNRSSREPHASSGHGTRRPRSPSPSRSVTRRTASPHPRAVEAPQQDRSAISESGAPAASHSPDSRSPPANGTKTAPRRGSNSRYGFGIGHAVAALAQAQGQGQQQQQQQHHQRRRPSDISPPPRSQTHRNRERDSRRLPVDEREIRGEGKSALNIRGAGNKRLSDSNGASEGGSQNIKRSRRD